VNGYVVAGWSVTAVVLALYTWRLIRRGHLLSRALPEEPLAATSRPVTSSAPVGDAVVPPSFVPPSVVPAAMEPTPDRSVASERAADAPGPSPEVSAWR
jgi:hypothetical protein